MKTISTDNAHQAIGPYSQAIQHCNLIFCSGQIPLRPNGSLEIGTIEQQTKQVMANLKNVLLAADSSFEKVLKVTIYLSDIENFKAVNEIYAEYFPKHKPARACVEVSRLPKDVKIEIDCIATLSINP